MLQLEVAGTVIQLEDTEAALIIYCHPSWKGKRIEVKSIHTPDKADRFFSVKAHVISRQVGNDIVYAAIFTWINIISDYQRKYTDERSANCEIVAQMSYVPEYGWNMVHDYVTLSEGNVTEADWTDKEWK